MKRSAYSQLVRAWNEQNIGVMLRFCSLESLSPDSRHPRFTREATAALMEAWSAEDQRIRRLGYRLRGEPETTAEFIAHWKEKLSD